MGYDGSALRAELEAQPTDLRFLAGDAWRTLADIAKEPVRVHTRNRRLGTPNVLRQLLRG